MITSPRKLCIHVNGYHFLVNKNICMTTTCFLGLRCRTRSHFFPIVINAFLKKWMLYFYKYISYFRLLWLIVIGISIYINVYMIRDTYQKWVTSPVIVSFAKSPTPVWQVPFPAVTICPVTKSKQTIFNFTDLYHRVRENPENVTEEEWVMILRWFYFTIK